MKKHTMPATLSEARTEVRLQVELPAEFGKDLEDLGTACGFSSKRETVVSALSTLMWVVTEIMADRRIGSLDANGAFREMVPAAPRLMSRYFRSSDARRRQSAVV